MSEQILTVLQLNEYLKAKLDADPMLGAVAVKGELSNYKVYPSGHHYFTLKDAESSLRCVLFRGNAMRLRFHPDNGMQVIAMGKISVYPRDGGYQLYCTNIVPDGAGDLHTAFEQLKTKLAAQGLFDPQYKKPIPKHPKTIGIVTSSAGAAIHDILRILRKRYPMVNVRLLPVRVQGTEAPGEIAAAIAYANRYSLADVLIVGRGGGSIEDLWAFNDERVAYAIFKSRIPIISAVGHEPDFTISDFVADLRAATPSNAAELAVPDCDALRQSLDGMTDSMTSALQRQLNSARRHWQMLAESPVLRSPQRYVQQRRKDLQSLQAKLVHSQTQNLARQNQRYISLSAKLDAMSPLKVLTRGYAVAHTEGGNFIRSVNQVSRGDTIEIWISDGTVSAQVTDKEENNEPRQCNL